MKPSRTLTRASRPGWLLFLLALGVIVPAASGETLERALNCPTLNTSTDPSGRWTRLELPGAEMDVPFGAPALPAMRLEVALPAGFTVDAVRWEVDEQETVALPRPVEPYAGEQASTQAAPPTIAPDPAVYAGSALYPADPAQLVGIVQLSNGARFATVKVFPVQVRPALDELTWVKRGRLILTLSTEAATGTLPRLREPMTDTGAAKASQSTQGRLLLAEHGFAPTEAPSVEGSPIVFAIICPPDDAMATAWQALADWKTACGYPAAVIRTDWIDENYPAGSDQPERIRAFLRDAYLHWGLTWALIGGDVSRIPTRYARSWAYVPLANGTDIATDYYYACLEGNWDADGDGIFGESDRLAGNVGDNADLTPEIEVGRVSARSATEVNDFLEKYFYYTRTPPADGYLDRMLFLGEVLFHAEWTRTANGGTFDCQEGDCVSEHCRRSSDGQLICLTQDGASDVIATGDQIRGTLGLTLEQRFLLERFEHWTSERPDLNPPPELESSSSVMARMSEGCGIVHHVGHGDRDRWAVGDGRIEISQLVNLTNGGDHHYFWAYGINCNSAAIDFDSYGERMVLMPHEGAVAYLGCTNADFPSSARVFAADFYNFLFSTHGTTLGDGHFGAMAAHALTGDQINDESIYRFLLFTQILLGDPGMPVWRGTPTPLTASLVDHGNLQVPIGETALSVRVTAGATPLEGARVCVHKAGEVYDVGITGANGEVDVPFWPQTQGPFVVTATAADHLETTLNGTVVAASGGPALVVETLGIVDDGTSDSAGNGNASIEVGESIRLTLTLKNAGVAAANDVQATLDVSGDAPAGCVTVLDGSASLASIPAGGSGSDDQAFLLQYAYDPPDAAFGDADRIRIPFRLTLSSTSGSATVGLYLDLSRARMSVSVNRLTDSGIAGTKKLWLGVQNVGQGTASHLQGKLATENQNYILVSTPSVAQHDIAPGDTALVGPFRIRILDSIRGRLNFDLLDTAPEPDDTLHHRRLDVQAPGMPDSLSLTGLRAAMGLKWKAPVDLGDGLILGYKVYRTTGTGTPPFPEVVPDILEGHRFFTDSGLGELTRYSYYVAGVDAGGNVGASSLVQSAYTSPGASPGWPHLQETPTKASPLICELDGNTTSGRELIFGADCVYAFHGDGTEVNDGDRLERSSGPFGVTGPYLVRHPIWGKPAAGDIDDDGDVEVVAITFAESDTTNRGELICWPTWGGTPKWAVTFNKYWRSWDSPVLADLNADGKLEVIFCGGTHVGNHAGIYVFNSDGTPWASSDRHGRLKDLGARDLYQTPAVGDVDGDGLPEIVVATRTLNEADGALWVIRPNGDPLPGFNNLKFSTLGSPPLSQITTGSPSLCNVDGVAGDEIFVVTTRRLWAFKKGGTLLWGAPIDLSGTFNLNTYELLPEPALGDIDGDGQVDLALVDAGGKLRVLRASTGIAIAPFPLQLDATARYGSCILANVDSDTRPDIIFGDSKQHVYGYRFDGQLAAGFPINSGGDLVRQSLAAWDVDCDGYQNLVIQANTQQQLSVLSFVGVTFPTNESDIVRRNPWPMRSHDARNTGRLTQDVSVPVQLVLEDPQVSDAGEVLLAWTSGEAAASFRIRRASGSEGTGVVVGEVPGGSGEGARHFAFRDTPPGPGTYVYRVNPVRLDGVEAPGAAVEVSVGWTPPIVSGLQRITPDPLTSGRIATITFGVPGGATSQVPTRLDVFDVQGRRVRTLVDEVRPAGVHVIAWDGRDEGGRRLSTGLYLLRMEVRGVRSERRLMVVR